MSNEEILELLEDIPHPAINFSLVKLGILTDIQILERNVSATFAFPFPKIPIADQLINSVAITLCNFNIEFDYVIRMMTESEKSQFLKLEHEAWKGL